MLGALSRIGFDKMTDRFTEHQRKAGQATSERKKASSAANGKKGGRPKGSKNKPKEQP